MRLKLTYAKFSGSKYSDFAVSARLLSFRLLRFRFCRERCVVFPDLLTPRFDSEWSLSSSSSSSTSSSSVSSDSSNDGPAPKGILNLCFVSSSSVSIFDTFSELSISTFVFCAEAVLESANAKHMGIKITRITLWQ